MSGPRASSVEDRPVLKCSGGLIRKRSPVAALAAVAALFLSEAADARAIGRREPELARCISIAAQGRPWLERTLWGLRDQEAGWIGAVITNTNGSVDLGPLQVNSWWVGRLADATGRPADHVRWWLTYDPCFNVSAARWIFLSGLAVTRDYWKAVGIYHSPTRWRQLRYSASVALHLQQRFGADIFMRRPVSPSSQSRPPGEVSATGAD